MAQRVTTNVQIVSIDNTLAVQTSNATKYNVIASIAINTNNSNVNKKRQPIVISDIDWTALSMYDTFNIFGAAFFIIFIMIVGMAKERCNCMCCIKSNAVDSTDDNINLSDAERQLQKALMNAMQSFGDKTQRSIMAQRFQNINRPQRSNMQNVSHLSLSTTSDYMQQTTQTVSTQSTENNMFDRCKPEIIHSSIRTIDHELA